MNARKPPGKIDGRSTPARRAQIAALNAVTKRKYPREHGCRSRLFTIWKAMIFRCEYPSHEAFPRYGGRGIKIHEKWRSDYNIFLTWALASGYADHLTIERIDNEQGYGPENCRWATYREQGRNRCNNVWLTAFGETRLIGDWLTDPRCVVKKWSTIVKRLRWGYSPDDTLSIRRIPRGPTSEATRNKIAARARLRTDLRREPTTGRYLAGQMTLEAAQAEIRRTWSGK